jgi:hypothetical protein
MSEETIPAMDRTALLNAAAELKLNPGIAVTGASAEVAKPVSIWEQELELRRAELKAREEERKAEMEFRAAEARRQGEEREAEARRYEEQRRAEAEFREMDTSACARVGISGSGSSQTARVPHGGA